MAAAKHIDEFRERLKNYVLRTSGQGTHTQLGILGLGTAEAMAEIHSQPKVRARMPDGTPLQNPDGSFPHMPGYDGPAQV